MRYFYRTMRTAFQAQMRNPLLLGLATLLIVMGVGARIFVAEVGEGSKKKVEQTIQSMGSNNLLIMPGAASSGGVSFGGSSAMTLTPGDAAAIARECKPAVASVALIVRTRTQVVYGNKNWVPSYVYGSTPDFLDVREWDVDDGRSFTDQEVTSEAEVCMLGQTIVRELFGEESPVNKFVKVNGRMLKVVGVLDRKGANMMGIDQDDILLAPWTTIKFKVSGNSAQTSNSSSTAPTVTTPEPSQALPGSVLPILPVKSASELQDHAQPLLPTNVDQILVRVRSEPEIKGAISQITALLHERHKIHSGQPDDFNIRDMTELSKAMGSTTEVMGVWLLAMASVVLLVGGIAIMAIMLISVMQRTKEIGLRMAVGARARDILRQFLFEAILLCLVGGALGIVLGFAVSRLIFRNMLHIPTESSPRAMIEAVGISLAVGVIFGYYPAWKASRLDPIDALRYE